MKPLYTTEILRLAASLDDPLTAFREIDRPSTQILRSNS